MGLLTHSPPFENVFFVANVGSPSPVVLPAASSSSLRSDTKKSLHSMENAGKVSENVW